MTYWLWVGLKVYTAVCALATVIITVRGAVRMVTGDEA